MSAWAAGCRRARHGSPRLRASHGAQASCHRKWSKPPRGVRLPSTSTPCAAGDPADHRPLAGGGALPGTSRPARGRRRRPAPSPSDPPRARRRRRDSCRHDPARTVSSSIPTPLAIATWLRSATSPSLTSTIAVAPSSAAVGPSAYGGSGRRCAATSDTGERKPRAEHGQPGGGPAEPAGDRDHVAGAGAGPGHRRAALQVAERGDGERQRVDRGPRRRRRTVAPTMPHSVAHPVGEALQPVTRGPAARQADQQPGRRRAHGGDVGQVLRGRLAADVVRARTSPGGSAGRRPAGRWWPPPGRPARPARPRRRPGRAGSPGLRPAPARTARSAARRTPNSPTSATVMARILSVIPGPSALLYVLCSHLAPTTKGLAVVQAYILIQTEVGKAA